MDFVFPSKSFPQVLNKSQSSQLKGLEALHNAEASEVMKRLGQESKVEATLVLFFSLVYFTPPPLFNTHKKSHTSTQFVFNQAI